MRQQAYSSAVKPKQTARVVSNTGTATRAECGTLIINNGLMDCVFATAKKVPKPSITAKNIYSNGSIPSIIGHIFKNEGLAGIYAGLAPTLIMAIPSTVLYFLAYDSLRSLGNDNNYNSKPGERNSLTSILFNTLSTPLGAGMTSRVFASTLISPLELVRTRTMNAATAKAASGSNMPTPTYSQAVRSILKSSGVRGLWSGLGPTLWRDVPFSGIYWYSLETIKQTLIHSYRTSSDIPYSEQLPFHAHYFISFASGFSGGVIASNFTTPFDVVKTRRQTASMVPVSVSLPAKTGTCSTSLAAGIQVRCNHNGATAAPVVKHSFNQLTPKCSTFQMLSDIYRNEGVAGLWRGNLTRSLRVGPACAIMISSYEMGKRFLIDEAP